MTVDHLPKSPEQDTQKLYEAKANAYIASMADYDPNSDEAFKATEVFIDSILPIEGDVIEGHKEAFTNEALIDRFAIYFDQNDKLPEDRELPNPSFALTRTDGLRSAIEAVMANHITHLNFQRQMMLRIEVLDQERAVAEQLRSEENIHKAGGVGLDAAEVSEPIPDGGDPLAEAAVKAAVGLIDRMPETELEMNQRFLRETRAELDGLYGELRVAQSKPEYMRDRNEEDQIARAIKYAKEDAGKYASKVAKLGNGADWTRGGSS